MELDTIGDRKTALFVIISDTDDTFNFVVSILYTQLFNLLCDKADDEYGGRLPVHVRCLLDEFANIGQIPKFEKLIATIRSREISASIILQSQSQLKAIYKDNADTIVGNCDTTLFLGGKEKTTLKEISEILGKETIDSFNTSETRGRELSHGLNYQKLGKQLMTEDEIAVMDGGKCILQLRGVRPFFSDKFDITKHPKYKYLSDADPKNAFDMEKHLRRRPAIVKPDEVYPLLRSYARFCQTSAKEKRCNPQKKITTLSKPYSILTDTSYLPSVSTSAISFAVALTIRMPVSLIPSRSASSCRRCVFFSGGVSKRNWSTDIL